MGKNIENLMSALSEFGQVEICKAGYVFTLLMTGKGLTKSTTMNSIQMMVLEFTGDDYPTIECMRNDENYVCIVLKPNEK